MPSWAKQDGKVVKEDGKIVVNVECCCIIPCPCEPPGSVIPVCIIADTEDFHGQRVWLYPVTPKADECRRYEAFFEPFCCEGVDVQMALVWIAAGPFDSSLQYVRLRVSVDGNPESEYFHFAGDCDPFCFEFSGVSFDGDVPCGTATTVQVGEGCFSPATCYCPPPGSDYLFDTFPEAITGRFDAPTCDFDGKQLTLHRLCVEDPPDCLCYAAYCFLLGCSGQTKMSIRICWSTSGSDITGVTLKWRIEPSTTWNTVSPLVPPSTCDPFCAIFEEVPLISELPSGCCSLSAPREPRFIIGACAECCCPQFEDPLPTMTATVTLHQSGQVVTETLTGQPIPGTGCAEWLSDYIDIPNDPPNNCENVAFRIVMWCPVDGVRCQDMLMTLETPSLECEHLPIIPRNPLGCDCDRLGTGRFWGYWPQLFNFVATEGPCDCGLVSVEVNEDPPAAGSFSPAPLATRTPRPRMAPIRPPAAPEPPPVEEDELPEAVKKWLDAELEEALAQS